MANVFSSVMYNMRYGPGVCIRLVRVQYPWKLLTINLTNTVKHSKRERKKEGRHLPHKRKKK